MVSMIINNPLHVSTLINYPQMVIFRCSILTDVTANFYIYIYMYTAKMYIQISSHIYYFEHLKRTT